MPALPASISSETRDVRHLNGRPVLVRSARDDREPPTASYGWIEVVAAAGETFAVNVVLEFPQMFLSRAHRKIIPLAPGEVERLMRLSADLATLEITVADVDPTPQ